LLLGFGVFRLSKRPRGMRDFMPEEMSFRRRVIEVVRRVFELFGFGEVDTPALELWEVLSAKCGDEVKEQIYCFQDKAGRWLGLRFDLTVPLARVVASSPTLVLPFKRYCIGKVWRYEEPQSGRFREFVQADADIVGSDKPDADAEVLAVASTCLERLGLNDFVIELSNRKVLEGIMAEAGVSNDRFFEACRILDKLDKVGREGVVREFYSRGFPNGVAERVLELTSVSLDEAEEVLRRHQRALEGVKEVEEIIKLGEWYGFADKVKVDFSLARGLDYYTGPVFEFKVRTYGAGSVAGGGRYDDLIERIGGRALPATGVSLGIERIIEVLSSREGRGGYRYADVFIAAVDESVKGEAVKLASLFRSRDVRVEVDLMGRRLSRQLEYADSKNIPFVVIVGKREVEEGKVRLRDMVKREEVLLSADEALQAILSKLS
ncbi:MAG: histidine--tRNA ligase, partial [Candidatus Methanomethylicota archaeon]